MLKMGVNYKVTALAPASHLSRIRHCDPLAWASSEMTVLGAFNGTILSTYLLDCNQLSFDFIVKEAREAFLNQERYDLENTPIYAILRPYVGKPYAHLLFKLGYERLTDLCEVCEYSISQIPGFGPVRLAAIRQAMQFYGLQFLPVDDPNPRLAAFRDYVDEVNSARTRQPELKLYFHPSAQVDGIRDSSSCSTDRRAPKGKGHLKLVP